MEEKLWGEGGGGAQLPHTALMDPCHGRCAFCQCLFVYILIEYYPQYRTAALLPGPAKAISQFNHKN